LGEMRVSQLAFRVGRAGYARRPVAVGQLLVPTGPSGHESGKISCWRVGEMRVGLNHLARIGRVA
jgi:hypothetical protein